MQAKSNTGTPAPENSLLDLHHAAERLGVSHRTVWSLTKDGTLPTVRIGRRVLVNARALDEWIATRTTGGAA